MPIYEYQCECCGTRKDYLLPLGKNPEAISCEDCERGSRRKIFSLFGIGAGGLESRDPHPGSSATSSCGSCKSRNCSHCH